jgi:hypothetical protein
MTTYEELTQEEKSDLTDELCDRPEIYCAVVDGYYCAKCIMSYYNCLCGHDDDE